MPRQREEPRLKRIPGRRKWYIIDGREKISTGCEDESEAEQALADYLIAKAAPRAGTTVGDLLDARLAELKALGKARYEVALYIVPRLKKHFGDLRPDQVAEPTIKAYLAKIRGKGQTDLEELRAALPKAYKENVAIPERGYAREEFLTPTQQQALIDATAERYHLRLFTLLALYTGARHGAIVDLTWDRVADDCSRVDFRNPERPKVKKRRTAVRCAAPLRAALQDARQLRTCDHVIEWNGRPVKRIRRSFERAAIRAGLISGYRTITEGKRKGEVVPVTWCTPHVLKHTAISNLLALGFSRNQAALFTETSEDLVSRVYRHIHGTEIDAMAEALGEFGTKLTSVNRERCSRNASRQ